MSDIEPVISQEITPNEQHPAIEANPADKPGETAAQTKTEVSNLIKKLNLKIDGQDFEEELPFEIAPEHAEWLKNQLQMAKVAPKRMQESANLRKKFENFVSNGRQNPESMLQELGINAEEFAEILIARKVDEMGKTPEQRATEQKDAELAMWRKRAEQVEFEKKQSELMSQQQKALADVTSDINNAIKAHGKLPENEFIQREVANLWHRYLSSGQDVSAEQVVNQVYSQLTDLYGKMADSMPDEALESFINKKTADRLRKGRINKMPDSLSGIKEVNRPVERPEGEFKKINVTEWLKSGKPLSELAKH